jgi:hypothetical protein
MLFTAIYTPKNESEQSQRRSLQLFTIWKPPFEFKAHYARADGKGGIAIFDADDPAVVLEGIAPFTPFFDFEVTPVTEIENAVSVFQRVNEWRDSVRAPAKTSEIGDELRGLGEDLRDVGDDLREIGERTS